MNRMVLTLLLIACCIAVLSPMASAWDVTYDGSVFPNDTTLGQTIWKNGSRNDLSGCSVQDGLLHLSDQATDKTALFSREPMLPSGTPITIEARVKVLSGASAFTGDPPARIELATVSGRVVVGLWPSKVTCSGSESSVDMTTLHTIRVGLRDDNQYRVWVDGTQLFSGTAASGSQSGIAFGSSWQPGGTVDSYWDYVSYSKAYIPVE